MENTIKIERWARFADIIGFVLSIVSAVFTVKLMLNFANDGTERLLYGVYGGAIQAAQVTLFVYGSYLGWKGESGKAAASMALFILLMALSLVGTMGAFSVSSSMKTKQVLTNDYRFTDIQKRIQIIDDQIAESQKNIEKYRRKNWIKKGVRPEQEKIADLSEKREELSTQLLALDVPSAADGLYASIAKLFGTQDIQGVKTGLFLAYAIALDGCAALLLSFSLGLHKKKLSANPDQPGYLSKKTANANANPSPEPAFTMSEKQSETAKLQNSESDPANLYSTIATDVPAEKKKNPIGFVSGTQPARTSDAPPDIIAYVRALYDGRDMPPTLRGRRRVADLLGIKNTQTDKYHSWLKQRQYIRVQGTKTLPVMPQSELLAKIA